MTASSVNRSLVAGSKEQCPFFLFLILLDLGIHLAY